MFGKGGRPHHKSRRRGLHSLEGKTASANIIWLPKEQAFSSFSWNKRRIPVVVPVTAYATDALCDPSDPSKPRKVKYCRVVRRMVRGRMRYFLQLVLEGLAPVRFSKKDVRQWKYSKRNKKLRERLSEIFRLERVTGEQKPLRYSEIEVSTYDFQQFFPHNSTTAGGRLKFKDPH